MTARIVLPVLCFSLIAAGANAQTAPPSQTAARAGEQAKPAAAKPPAPATREMPPDMKAFSETSRITDPAKKIEALEKFKKDFPDSAMAQSADIGILTTLVQKLPEQKDRIRKTAHSVYNAAAAKDKDAAKAKPAERDKPAVPAGLVSTTRRGSAAANIADVMLGSDAYLKDAEAWARKSIDLMKLPLYLAEQRESYTRRKQNIPALADLTKRFNEQRAGRVAILGRVEFKLGKIPQAQKLLEEAYAVNNSNINVSSALGEIAAKRGDDAKAFDYLMTTKLSGRMPETADAAFETVYKKQHNGTLDGLEAVLDTEYEKRFPNPVHPEVYQPTDKRTDRVVLNEIFTGSGCPPCVAADLAFDAAMQRYARKDFVVVMYHQHIPRPDPMTNPDSQARAKSYEVTGVPTYVIDGKKTVGGGSREMTKAKFDSIEKDISKELETASEAHIKVDASLAANMVKVAANVDQVKSDSKDLKVQILLVEKELRYSGENGVRFHPMVVRATGGEKAAGFALEPNGQGTFDASFDLDAVSKALKAHLDDYEAKGHRGETFKFTEKKYQINRGDLAVVVFVQDDKTKHVLQAAYVDLGGPAGTRTSTEALGNGNQHQ